MKVFFETWIARFAKASLGFVAIFMGRTTRYPGFVKRFEDAFAAFVGRNYGVSFCNGTSSIEAALFALKLQAGDEVIVPSYTIHPSISPILNCGAKAVFADIDPLTLTLDLKDVASRITSKTKAIMPVHIWGNPVNMDALMSLANERNIAVVEDCSHAHGAQWSGKMLGSFGRIGCFSLQGEKPIAAGEGGVAVTDDRELYERMQYYGHFGRLGGQNKNAAYDSLIDVGAGFKKRMAPVGALLAFVDLKLIHRRNLRWRKLRNLLLERLKAYPQFKGQQAYSKALMGGFFKGFVIRVPKDLIAQMGSLKDVQKYFEAKGLEMTADTARQNHRRAVFLSADFRHRLFYGEAPSLDEAREIEEAAEALKETEAVHGTTLHFPLDQFVSGKKLARLESALQELSESIPNTSETISSEGPVELAS